MTFDAISISAFVASGGATLAHTCTGSNLRLWAYAYVGNNSAITCAYNGTSMTAGPFFAMTGGAAGQYIRSWYLDNPTTGTHNIAWTTTANMYGFGASYTGVAQTGTLDSNNTGGTSSATSLTVSTTTVADNCWLTGFAYTSSAETAGANTTIRGSTVSQLYIIDSNSAQTPAGSKSMNVTWSPSGFGGMLVVSNAPVTSTSTQGLLMML